MANAPYPHGPTSMDWALDLRSNPLAPSVEPGTTQNPLEMSLEAEDQLRRDVAALLFRNVRDPSTWEHLGETTAVRNEEESQRRKHVRVDPTPHFLEDQIEFLDLPVGLGLLFDAATSEEFENIDLRNSADALPPTSYLERLAASRAASSSRASSADRSEPAPVNPGDADDAKSAKSDGGKSNKSAKSAKSAVSAKSAAARPAAEPAPQDEAKQEPPAPIDPVEASRLIRLQGPPKNLIYMLTLFATPPTLDDTCLRLYHEGMARLAKVKATDAERARKIREAEDRECTFHPKIKHERDPEKPLKFDAEAFYKTALDWEKKVKSKLEKTKLKDKQDFESDVMVPWKMNETSRAIVEARRAKAKQSVEPTDTDAQTPPPASAASPARSTASQSQRGLRSFDSEFYTAARTPITNHRLESIFRSAVVTTANTMLVGNTSSARRSHNTSANASTAEVETPPKADATSPADSTDAAAVATRHAEQGGEAASPDSTGTRSKSMTVPSAGDAEGDDDYDDIPLDRIVMLDMAFTVFRHSDAAKTTPVDVVERMGRDIAERRKRAERRADLYQKKQREKLFDKATGQPLFIPNSMPAAFKHGKRLMWEQLSANEQRDFTQACFRQGIDIQSALRIAHRRATDGKEKRSIDEVVSQLLLKKKQAEGKIAKARRKKAEEEARELESNKFRSADRGPSVSSNGGTGYVPLHKRPLPKKAPEAPAPAHRSDPVAIQHVIARGNEFVKHRDHRIAKAAAAAAKEEEGELRPYPKINPVSELLIQQHRHQLLADLDALQQYEEHQRSKSQRYYDAETELQGAARPRSRELPPQTAAGAAARPRLIPSGAAQRPRATESASPSSASEMFSPSPFAPPKELKRPTNPVSPPVARSMEDLVDELLSAGRQRAPAHEPQVPAAMARTQMVLAAAEANRQLTFSADPELVSAVLNPAPRAVPAFAVASSLEEVSMLDDEALKAIASPVPPSSRLTATASMPPPPPRGAVTALGSEASIRSKSVEEMLDVWKQLDRMSAEVLLTDL